MQTQSHTGPRASRASPRKALLLLNLVFLGAAVVIALANQPAQKANALGAPFREGDILYAGVEYLVHINPQFGQIDSLDDAGVEYGDLTFDSSGNLVVFDYDSVLRYSSQGIFLGEWFATEASWALAVDGSDNVYIPDDDGTLLKYGPTGSLLDDFTVALGGGEAAVDHLAIAEDDCTIAYTNGDTTVHRYNACTETQLSNIGSGLNYALRVEFTVDGDILVADLDVIRLYDSGTGSLIETYGTPSSGVQWGAIAVADEDFFYGVNQADNLIHVFELATGDEVGDMGEYGFGEGSSSGPDLVVWQGPDVLPQTSTSWYVTDLDENAVSTAASLPYQRGCALRAVHNYGAVILDFGQAWSDEVEETELFGVQLLPDNGFRTIAQIEVAAKRFITGYANPACAPDPEPGGPYLYLILGVNNLWLTVNHTTYDHGLYWAAMVNRIANWIYEEEYIGDWVEVSAGLDAESDYNTPEHTLDWADGYADVAEWPYYDFGAADGCPDEDEDALHCNTRNEWTMLERYSVAFGHEFAHPFPEVYLVASVEFPAGQGAEQWRRLSQWAFDNSLPAMQFIGVLTQEAACNYTDGTESLLDDCIPEERNSPENAFNELWDGINSPGSDIPAYIGWSSDVSWEWE